MTCWAVIPIKPAPDRKRRLAHALGSAERHALVAHMAAHVIETARGAAGIDHVAVLGTLLGAPLVGVEELADPGGGLSAAAGAALGELAKRGATRVVFVAADLPLVTADEIGRLANSDNASIALAPDRHRTGTNAIALPLPAASRFAFGYGPGSLARHRDEAARMGLSVTEVIAIGLMRDVDEPADLADATALIGAKR